MYKIMKQNDHIAYDIKEYVLDTEEDLQSLPSNITMGSMALVISTNNIYIYNSKKEWVKL